MLLSRVVNNFTVIIFLKGKLFVKKHRFRTSVHPNHVLARSRPAVPALASLPLCMHPSAKHHTSFNTLIDCYTSCIINPSRALCCTFLSSSPETPGPSQLTQDGRLHPQVVAFWMLRRRRLLMMFHIPPPPSHDRLKALLSGVANLVGVHFPVKNNGISAFSAGVLRVGWVSA